MEYRKSLDWERSETYLHVRHHDEYYKSGGVHLVHVIRRGSILELHDGFGGAVPDRSRQGGDGPPRRVTMRSGLTDFIVPEESFHKWWDWFENRHLHNDTFVLRVCKHLNKEDIPDWLKNRCVELED